MNILTKSLNTGKKAFRFTTRAFLLISLALITCTCSGPKLMLGNQTLGKQTDYSLSSGKLAWQIADASECATLRIGGPVLASWPAEQQFIWQQYLLMRDSGSYPNQAQMLRRCLQIRWYLYQSTILSSSNQFRTEWTGRRPSSPTVYPRPKLPESPSIRYPLQKKNYRDLIRPSTGRTPVITPTTVKSSNF